MARINIIGESNGVGLTRDINLLVEVLVDAGFNARVIALDARQGRKRRSRFIQLISKIKLFFSTKETCLGNTAADINIMLEHIWHEYLFDATINIVMPNPEWFDRHDLKFLKKINGVWAKTENTKRIFSELGCKIYGTGFISEDRRMPCGEKQRRFLHVAGKSVMKGTRELLQCWVAHPEWPKLTVVQNTGSDHEFKAHNIEYIIGYLVDEELRLLQNRHWFHVCTSQTEGWGHYIMEALSCGAVVLATNAPPMNEMVSDHCGVLVESFPVRYQKLARCYAFEAADLVASVERVMAMSDQELAARGDVARSWYLKKVAAFKSAVKMQFGAIRD